MQLYAQTYRVNPIGSATISCGVKPIPAIGCRIDRCVSGRWNQICDSYGSNSYSTENYNTFSAKPLGDAAFDCGIRPIPRIGCRVDRCVNGRWTQICGQGW